MPDYFHTLAPSWTKVVKLVQAKKSGHLASGYLMQFRAKTLHLNMSLLYNQKQILSSKFSTLQCIGILNRAIGYQFHD